MSGEYIRVISRFNLQFLLKGLKLNTSQFRLQGTNINGENKASG